MATLISVDPGMNLGWAYWVEGDLIDYGQITAKHRTLAEDLFYLFHEFDDVALRLQPEKVLIEYPNVWEGSAVSAAAQASGDLLKLAAIVGGIGAISACHGADVAYVLPGKWKGQMGKDAVKMRVRRALGVEERSSHMNDAIGIGLWSFGKFKIANKSRPFS